MEQYGLALSRILHLRSDFRAASGELQFQNHQLHGMNDRAKIQQCIRSHYGCNSHEDTEERVQNSGRERFDSSSATSKRAGIFLSPRFLNPQQNDLSRTVPPSERVRSDDVKVRNDLEVWYFFETLPSLRKVEKFPLQGVNAAISVLFPFSGPVLQGSSVKSSSASVGWGSDFSSQPQFHLKSSRERSRTPCGLPIRIPIADCARNDRSCSFLGHCKMNKRWNCCNRCKCMVYSMKYL